MPAVSKTQQQLMGMVHRYNKGDFPDAPEIVKDIAKSMKKKDTKEFAATKHKGLPKHVKKRKKKKKSSKAELIVNLIKLANDLDSASNFQAADLVDRYIKEVLEGTNIKDS